MFAAHGRRGDTPPRTVPEGYFAVLKPTAERLAQRPGEDPARTPGAAAVPRLARLLWLLIERAGTNLIEALDDRPAPSIRHEFGRLRAAAQLREHGYRPNQKLVFLSDGGENVRTLGRRIDPEAEHVLNWFHVAMRVTALGQMAKGAAPGYGWRDERLGDLERIKHLLWHGHAREAVERIEWLQDDVELAAEEATGESKAKLDRLATALGEFQVYIRRDAGSVVDYGERYRASERISSGFVESAINQVVAKRFSKRQSMRWTKRGAHLALQTRTRVLNGELEGAFRRRWPGFRAGKAA